ncbi:MAG: NADH-quinone oxidoreductase subunit H [Fimbriimonadaceae bacterium]|nr:NADH-quinone oxidoreductase subunit H [Fimbriimonadaceae bacterium]
MTEWLLQQNDIVKALIRAALIVVPILTLVPGLIWWERRLLSWMQDRIGPNRVATFTFSQKFPIAGLRGKKLRIFGLLQPIADGVKLFFKEDITPASIDKMIYFIAPALALFPAFAIGATMPWGPNLAWTPVADVNIGILYMLAISSLGVYGVVLAGYASNNKYSLLGGLRASAQLISYELAMGMSLAAIVVVTGSLKMTEMVTAQQGPWLGLVAWFQNWNLFTPTGFIAGIIFLICMVAETNRAPFDLPEAENELIAGYHTEYSSMKFAVFFMGEYATMMIFSGIFAVVFLGGYNLPINVAAVTEFATVAAPLIFMVKVAAVFSIFIWLRATLPRLRYDQLMNLGWKSLLPLAVANFIIAAVYVLVSEVYSPAAGAFSWIASFVLLYILWSALKAAGSKSLNKQLGKRTVTLVNPSAGGVPEIAEPAVSPGT